MKKRISLFGFVVLIALFFSAPVAFARWQHEVFDTIISTDEITQSEELDVAIGTDGSIHVLYFKDRNQLSFPFDSPFYAYKDESGWHIENLTQLINWPPIALEIYSPSLSLDSNNSVYISYSNGPNLYLLTNAAGSWVTEAIVSNADGTLNKSKMIIDSHDFPHLVYFSYSDGHHYVYKDNTGWHDELLEEITYFNANAWDLDSNGSPHIVYRQNDSEGNCLLAYAYKADTGWNSEIINEGECSTDHSLDLDSNDKAHVISRSYDGVDTYTFYYTTNASGSWVTESVVNSKYPPFLYPSAIRLDANDNPHFSYNHSYPLNILATADLSESSIWHVQRDISGWRKKLVKRACTFAFYPWPGIIVGNSLGLPAMELDMNGNPHIFYLSTFYLYNSLLQFFPDSSFPGVTTYWNHIYYEP